MKTFKRNAVIVTVMLFVCAAVYLNWSYNKEVEDAANAGGGNVEASGSLTGDHADISAGDLDEGESGLYYSVSGKTEDPGEATDPVTTSTGEYDEYFAKVRLERQQARDEASATLSAVASAAGASQETIDGALSAMSRIAQWTVKEAEIENLIRAKGFIDCVVYLSDSGATVTVASEEELTNASVAKITDVIVTETEFGADQLKVIPIS